MTNDCRQAFERWLDGNSTYKDGERDCWELWQVGWQARAEVMGGESARSRSDDTSTPPTPTKTKPVAAHEKVDWVDVGAFYIRPGGKGRIYIGCQEGEGGEFPLDEFEQTIASFYDERF